MLARTNYMIEWEVDDPYEVFYNSRRLLERN
jgi:hypothetical protein